MIFSLLIFAIILCVAVWIVRLLPLPPPIPLIMQIIIGVFALMWLLHAFGAWGGSPVFRGSWY